MMNETSEASSPCPGLLIVDMQDKLLSVMRDADAVIARCAMLIAGAKTLGVPVFATEQVPKKLGSTHIAIAEHLDGPALPKTRFSAFGAEALAAQLFDKGVESLAIVGIETHVCVQGTAIEALARGYEVLIAEDATTTRLATTHGPGLARMRQEGAKSTSAEALLFEWMKDAKSSSFRSISALVKEGR